VDLGAFIASIVSLAPFVTAWLAYKIRRTG
jgi:hypothetical protein